MNCDGCGALMRLTSRDNDKTGYVYKCLKCEKLEYTISVSTLGITEFYLVCMRCGNSYVAGQKAGYRHVLINEGETFRDGIMALCKDCGHDLVPLIDGCNEVEIHEG